MHVEVEDVLPRLRAAVLAKVGSGRSQMLANDRREALGRQHDRSELVLLDIPDVHAMTSRDDERVTPGRRRLAQKRDNDVVGPHDLLRAPAGHDVAERTTLAH